MKPGASHSVVVLAKARTNCPEEEFGEDLSFGTTNVGNR